MVLHRYEPDNYFITPELLVNAPADLNGEVKEKLDALMDLLKF